MNSGAGSIYILKHYFSEVLNIALLFSLFIIPAHVLHHGR